jgi:hypothetical protein
MNAFDELEEVNISGRGRMYYIQFVFIFSNDENKKNLNPKSITKGELYLSLAKAA